MNVHKNARLTPRGRAVLVARIADGESVPDAARRMGVSARTAAKWWRRWCAEGAAGLADRSSRPRRSPTALRRTPRRQIARLRRRRRSSLYIARHLGLPLSTVVRVQRQLGLNRLARLETPRPVVRYERARPGELLHLDVKKLARIARVGHRIHGDRTTRVRGVGWEFLHVCIDDASRIAFTMIMPNEKAVSAVAFLKAAIAYYQRLGITVARVMTDNGSCYKAFAFRDTCRAQGLKHIRTRPYTPKTNGKAERFIQTALRE